MWVNSLNVHSIPDYEDSEFSLELLLLAHLVLSIQHLQPLLSLLAERSKLKRLTVIFNSIGITAETSASVGDYGAVIINIQAKHSSILHLRRKMSSLRSRYRSPLRIQDVTYDTELGRKSRPNCFQAVICSCHRQELLFSVFPGIAFFAGTKLEGILIKLPEDAGFRRWVEDFESRTNNGIAYFMACIIVQKRFGFGWFSGENFSEV